MKQAIKAIVVSAAVALTLGGGVASAQESTLTILSHKVHENVSRANVLLHFAGMQFPQPGLYHLQLHFDGVFAGEVTLHLQQVGHQA